MSSRISKFFPSKMDQVGQQPLEPTCDNLEQTTHREGKTFAFFLLTGLAIMMVIAFGQAVGLVSRPLPTGRARIDLTAMLNHSEQGYEASINKAIARFRRQHPREVNTGEDEF